LRQPHEILGVPRNASKDQIKAAYRRLAKLYHPDFNSGDTIAEARFKEVTNAYQQMSAPKPEPLGMDRPRPQPQPGRAQPNGAQNGANARGPFAGARSEPGSNAKGSAGFRQRKSYQDAKEDKTAAGSQSASGSADAKARPKQEAPHREAPKQERAQTQTRERARTAQTRKGDFQDELNRAREGAQRGAEKTAERPRTEEPETVNRAKPEGESASAFAGFFSGLRRAGKQAVGGASGEDEDYTLTVSFTDAALGATKRVKLASGKVLDVKIPAGLSEGQQIRLRGQGEPGRFGSTRGDALITVTIEPHEDFEREGLDISANVPIGLAEAILGAKIRVKTLHGSVAVTVPPGSSSGRRLRLQGQGIRPAGGGKAGDHFATLQIVLPDEIDPALKSFIAGWAQGKGGRENA
jgi:DnaJ-class molecular chaperone